MNNLLRNHFYSSSTFQIEQETNVRILMDHMAMKEELEDKLTVMREDIERMERKEAEDTAHIEEVNFIVSPETNVQSHEICWHHRFLSTLCGWLLECLHCRTTRPRPIPIGNVRRLHWNQFWVGNLSWYLWSSNLCLLSGFKNIHENEEVYIRIY